MTNPGVDGAPISPLEADLGCIADPPHGWDPSHEQFNGGRNDGFIQAYASRVGDPALGHRVMDYLPRAKQTASWRLAEEYALCQRWFASVMGPTWPNRFYLLACSSHGRQANDFISEPIETIFSKMDRAKLPWANYYGNIQFAVTLDISSSFPEVEPLDQFFADAEAGTLPPVVILDPLYGRSDDHPPAHPVAGQLFIQSIYEALRTSPQWNECMFVVTYDEHGGFHDHVAPPLTDDDRADEGFDQLGFRVPSFAVGPWVKNHVSDVVFDHTSVYATIAALHGLEPIGARDAAANPLFSLLDVDRMKDDAPRAGIALDPIVADEAEIFADECKGVRFHVDGVEHEAVTGQPELEAALARKDPARFARLRADTDGVWRDLVDRARRGGLLKIG
jgi:phospholipase C